MSFKERAIISNKLPTNLDALTVPFTFKANNGSFENANKGDSFDVVDEVATVSFVTPTRLTAFAILYSSFQDSAVNFKVVGEGYETERIFFINKYRYMWAILKTDIPKPVTSLEITFHQKMNIIRVIPLASFEEEKTNKYFSISTENRSIFSEKLVVPNLRSGKMMKIPTNLTLLKARVPALIDSLEQYGDSEDEFLCKALCELALVHPLAPERLIDYICTGDIESLKMFLFLLSPNETEMNHDKDGDNGANNIHNNNNNYINSNLSSPSTGNGEGNGFYENENKSKQHEKKLLRNINIMQLPKEYLKVDDGVTSVIRLRNEDIYIKNNKDGKFYISPKGNDDKIESYVKLLDLRNSLADILQQLKISRESFDSYMEKQLTEVYLPIIRIGNSKFVCVGEIISDIYYISLAKIIVDNTENKESMNVETLENADYKVSEYLPSNDSSEGYYKKIMNNAFFGPNDIGWFSEDNEIFGKLLNGELFDPDAKSCDTDLIYEYYPRNFMFVILILKFYYDYCLSYLENGICTKPKCMSLLIDDLLELVPENIWGRKEFIDIVTNNLSPDSIDIAKYSSKFLDCVVNEYADIYTLNVIAPYIIRDMVNLRNKKKKKGEVEYNTTIIKAGYWVRLKPCLTNHETRLLMTPNLETDNGVETNAMNDRLVGIYFEKLNEELGTKKPTYGWQGLTQKSRQTIGRVVYYDEQLDIGIMQIEGNTSFRFKKQDVLVVGNGRTFFYNKQKPNSPEKKEENIQIANYFPNIFNVPENPMNINQDEKYEPILEGNMDVKTNYPQMLQTRLRINSDIYDDTNAIKNDLFMWEVKNKNIERQEIESELNLPTIISIDSLSQNTTNIGVKLQEAHKLTSKLENKKSDNKEAKATIKKGGYPCMTYSITPLTLTSKTGKSKFEKLLIQKNITIDLESDSKIYRLNIQKKCYDEIIEQGGFKALKKNMDVVDVDLDTYNAVVRQVSEATGETHAPPADGRATVFVAALKSLLPDPAPHNT